MTPGTVPAAETSYQPLRGTEYPAGYIPTDVGQRTVLGAQPLGTNGYLWLTRNAGTSWSRVTI